MGTNYYLHKNTCPTCGTCEEKLHIGKSSAGWQFHFRGYKDKGIVSYLDWQAFLGAPNTVIKDEYGDTVSLDYFLRLVDEKKSEHLNAWNINSNNPLNSKEKEYLQNHPQKYPIDMSYEWKDNQGYAFTDWEFC